MKYQQENLSLGGNVEVCIGSLIPQNLPLENGNYLPPFVKEDWRGFIYYYQKITLRFILFFDRQKFLPFSKGSEKGFFILT
ncbi:MAG: hypothetical protein JSV84_15625 [Gemmatimonadota bacterium]|nr:MAG: hypothetical protein JSV84_15625 [Gemmatimonadota bacterium]